MSNLLIKLEPKFDTTLAAVLANNPTSGIGVGYNVTSDSSLGDGVVKTMFARTLDSLGIRVSGATRDAREQQWNIIVQHTTVAGVQALIDALDIACDAITRKGGGTLYYRSKTGTYVTRYKIGAAIHTGAGASINEYEGFFRAHVTIACTVDPFGLSDPYDIGDPFTTDTLGVGGVYNPGGADWTKVSGAAAAIAAGVLTAPNTTGVTIYTHTGTPHVYKDVQVTEKVVFTTRQTNAEARAIVKWIDASNYIYARLLDDGANSILSFRKVVAGADTALTTPVTVNLATRIASAGNQWLRARIEDNTVYAENWLTLPTPAGTPTDSVSGTLSAAEAAVFGRAVTGRTGFGYDGKGLTTIVFDDFDVQACVYRARTFPSVLPCSGAWGGTTDAQTAIYYTNVAGGTAPITMLYAWWPTAAVHNLIWNGNAEAVGTSATVAYGWSAAAVASVTAAATSITRTTTAASIRTGSAAFEITVPITAVNQGASFLIYGPEDGYFRKGVTYTATAWLRAATGTQTAQIGVSGAAGASIATSGAVALSTTYTQHTVTFTPTADLATVYFFTRTTTAAAQVWQMDDVVFYKGTVAPTFEPGGFGPGIIDAADYDTAKASVSSDGAFWTVAADATYRSGFRVRGTGAIASGQGNLEFYILPHLFTPDDFMGEEIDIAVYARCEIAATQTATGVSGGTSNVTCVLSVAPEGGTSYGARKYSGFKSSGKTLRAPITSTAFKPYYLGTVTCRVDRTNPARWKLRLAFANGASNAGVFGVDYVLLVPARNVAASQSGQAASVVPQFIPSTSQSTKLINSDKSGRMFDPASPVTTKGGFPDDGLLGERIMFDRNGSELLVWPMDQVVDLTDSSAATCALSFSGTVQVAVQPQHHLLRQS